MKTRDFAGYLALLITIAVNIFSTDAWAKEVSNVTTLPVVMWACVDWLRSEVPGFNDALGGEAPFLTALLLAFVLPGLAYLLQVFVFRTVPGFTLEGLGAAFGVGMTVASTIHHTTKQVEEAK